MSDTFSPLFPKVRYEVLSIIYHYSKPLVSEAVKIVLAKAFGTEEFHSGNVNGEKAVGLRGIYRGHFSELKSLKNLVICHIMNNI